MATRKKAAAPKKTKPLSKSEMKTTYTFDEVDEIADDSWEQGIWFASVKMLVHIFSQYTRGEVDGLVAEARKAPEVKDDGPEVQKSWVPPHAPKKEPSLAATEAYKAPGPDAFGKRKKRPSRRSRAGKKKVVNDTGVQAIVNGVRSPKRKNAGVNGVRSCQRGQVS